MCAQLIKENILLFVLIFVVDFILTHVCSLFHVISLTDLPSLRWQKHTNTEWPITSNDLIVLLSSQGTPVYGSQVLEGGDGRGVGISLSYLNILPISILAVTSKP